MGCISGADLIFSDDPGRTETYLYQLADLWEMNGKMPKLEVTMSNLDERRSWP